jgi:hypothetical protein
MARQVYTLFNFNLLYIGNTVKLVNSTAQQGFSSGATIQDQGYSWALALKNYGQLVNGISQVRLDQGDITIVGTVAYHPTESDMLLFTPIADTMPANNLDPVNAIIDPANVTVDSTLLNPVAGTRYLILNGIGNINNEEGPALWNRTGFPSLVAQTNDIIRYTGTHWTLDFDSSATSSVKYLTNLRTGIQYKWKDQQWTKAVEGRYGAGAWSFVP